MNPMVPELVHKFPAFYESRSSLPCSHEFAIAPIVCKVNPMHTIPTFSLQINFAIVLSFNRGLQSSHFSSDFLTKTVSIAYLEGTIQHIYDRY